MYERAQNILPGGDTRTVTFFNPYPFFVLKGKGCRLHDIDGNVYFDFLNNYTALIHGHAHRAIVKAASEQLKKGPSFAAPTESQCRLAEMICDRVKSVEQVRFCNTGTEATMMAIRAARIFSGKSRVVKMEGGYHGTHDLAEVSITPSPEKFGSIEQPESVPQSRGIPKSVLDEVIVVPFNNKQVTEKRITEHRDEIACVIVEPMLGAAGLIPQEEGYLQFLRDLTRKLNLLLIFDEIITFRLGFSGLQGIYGIEPELTTFGKIIGGGFPVGAFGGRKEMMRVFSPVEKGFSSHSGTFNGNPVTMGAGIACLEHLTPDVFERINSLGDLLRDGINKAFKKAEIKGQGTGMGSLVQPHFNPERIYDYRTAQSGNYEAMALVHLGLLERGINMAPRGECSISTPMSQKAIKAYLTAFEESLHDVKPFIAETSPELIQ
ncbi:MAG: hypothetical protein A2156_05995 [Deltaproteobacteria bacterium RBG_16_48_10]|nr:MAG: hypothetical protein A2156_05995 [Deltaproteobacteria bacterium RBG_16_48_10]